jgi:BolA protein
MLDLKMKRRSKIEKIIKEGFAPYYFSVLDVSEEHRGHQSFQENVESHFEIVIVSKIFNNKSKIDRHRMVNQTLKEEYLSDLHSVTIRALTVEEFS